ncbi:hypothetical protein ACFPTO_18710 [Paraburkholderia denitrificans]|uniref:Uncharacterized protein n=1 Tax=Paraburkholderia denitrificans TaxID=694025 RepID=A0ABW0JCR0_9BURK
MQSIFNDVYAVADAQRLRVWNGAGARDYVGESAFAVEHGGDPAVALATVLGALPKVRGAFRNRLYLRIGHPWTHAAVLPWQSGLWSESAWQAYARALFEARALRVPLAVRVAYARFGGARLAVALHDDVLRTCAEVSRAAGWQLAGCRDALSAALSAALQKQRASLGAGDYRFVLLQPGVVTCLFCCGGEWRDVVTLPRHAGQHLGDLIGAAALMCGQPTEGRTFVSTLDAHERIDECIDMRDGKDDAHVHDGGATLPDRLRAEVAA